MPKREVETLMSLDEYHAQGITYFEEVTQGDAMIGKRALNWYAQLSILLSSTASLMSRVVHEMLGQLNSINKPWTPTIVPSSLNRELVLAIEDSKLTGTNAKVVLKHLIDNPQSTTQSLPEILSELKMATSDGIDLRALCEESLAKMPDVAESLKKGHMKAMGRAIGDVMRRSGGAADAKKASRTILDILGIK